MSRGFCNVVDTNCEAPPAFRTGSGSFSAPASTKVQTKCYDCGEHVCKACSKFILTDTSVSTTTPTSRIRVCADCLELRARARERKEKRQDVRVG